MTDHEGEPAMKIGNKLLGRQSLVLFAGKKAWRREVMASFGLPRHESLNSNILVFFSFCSLSCSSYGK